MTKEELLAFINGEGKDTFNEVISELGMSKLDKTNVEKFLSSTDEGKSLLFSLNDKEYTRRHKKYMEEGGFAKDFEAEYQKRNPQMTEEQKKMRNLEIELENYKKMEVKRNNMKELSKMNEQYGLPEEVFELIVSDNLESSKTSLETIGTKYKSHLDSTVEKLVNEKLGGSPKPLGNTGTKVVTYAEYLKMTPEQRESLTTEQLFKIANE